MGLKNLIIAGNTGKISSNTNDQTFINIQGLGGVATVNICNTQTASTTLAQLTRVSNKSIETGGVTQATNASGIISINHSLGKIPSTVIVSVAGDNQYTVKDVGKTATAVSFKVFNGSAVLTTTEVSLSYYLSA